MKLSETDLDALTEIINIGVGRAAASLSEMIGTRIELRVPTVWATEVGELEDQPTPEFGTLSIEQAFEGKVTGVAALQFARPSAISLAGLLGADTELDTDVSLEIAGILTEVGNIVLNGILGSFANLLDTQLAYSIPEFSTECAMRRLARRMDGDQPKTLLRADATFSVAEHDIEGSLLVVFQLGSLETVLRQLTEGVSGTAE